MLPEVLQTLRACLNMPLPGTAAHLTMAPSYRLDGQLLQSRSKSCKEAAVLLPVFLKADRPFLLFIRRPEHLPHHAGQIAFPGGKRETGESLTETAIREAQEEIGLAPHTIAEMAPLTPLYIPPSNFYVHPFVAFLHEPPALLPNPAEVAEILPVPLSLLLQPSTRKKITRTIHGTPADIPVFLLPQAEIWGATAMILAEFLTLLQTSTNPDSFS